MKFLLCALVGIGSIWAQPGGGGRGPQVVSPEVLSDHRVTFRILAPNAQAVTLNAGDIPATAWPPAAAPTPGGGRGGRPLTKGENGVWEVTTSQPVIPGAFRYVFNVDGVTTMDPRNTSLSESNAQNWSMFFVPGEAFMETKDVAHGAVSSVTYHSKSLDKFRRMHVFASRLRNQQPEVSDFLSPPRRGRLRRFLDFSGARGLHPRQPDRGREGKADGGRDARRAHYADAEFRRTRRRGAHGPDAFQ
jgi:hypothetical protein